MPGFGLGLGAIAYGRGLVSGGNFVPLFLTPALEGLAVGDAGARQAAGGGTHKADGLDGGRGGLHQKTQRQTLGAVLEGAVKAVGGLHGALETVLNERGERLEFRAIHRLDPVGERGRLHERERTVAAQRVAARFGVGLENVVARVGLQIVLRGQAVFGQFHRLKAQSA